MNEYENVAVITRRDFEDLLEDYWVADLIGRSRHELVEDLIRKEVIRSPLLIEWARKWVSQWEEA
jgi:hypothetical protein